MQSGNLLAALTLGLAILLPVTERAIAAPITVADFGPSATITTFDGLGLPTFGNATPFVLDQNTYGTDNAVFRYLGFSFGTDTDLGFVNIDLGAPALLAGLFVGPGANDPTATGDFWSATVEFFDPSDASLGSVMVSGGAPATLQFAGWEDASGISRIRVTDTFANGMVMRLDDVTVQGVVPEPATLLLMGFGLAVLARRRL